MGRAYSAGNLSFEFTGTSASASKAIDDIVKKLKNLQTATQTLDLSNLSRASEQLDKVLGTIKFANTTSLKNLDNIATAFKSLSNALGKTDFTKATQGLYRLSNAISAIAPSLSKASASFKSLSDISKTINSLSRLPDTLENINKIDFGNLETSFNKLTTSVKPFLNELEKSKEALIALSNLVSKLGAGKVTGKGSGGLLGRFFGNNNFNMSRLLSLSSTIFLARRLGNLLATVVKYGSDYTETLNKWQVAMRNNVDYAQDFVDKMNEAYGISRETLMDAQSTFKNMIGSLGQISEETAYNLSKGITQMAIDYSSLYNVQLETAFSKFQAMLAGQVRPIRTDSGYDITETTLFQLYQSLGGEKSMRQLTRTEKQLLSVLSVFRQMDRSGALGDMSKTITTFANQSRIMSENMKELATWVGVVFTTLMENYNVLTYMNAVLIAITDVAKEFAYSIGYVDPDFGLGWSENVENTTLALEELNGKLLGFDKFRALKGSSDDNLGIDKVLEDAIAGYTTGLIKAESPARDIADSIIEALGGVDNITAKTKEFLPIILKVVGVLAGISAVKIIIGSVISGIKLLFSSTSLLTIGIGVLLAGIQSISGVWDDMRGWEKAATVIASVAAAVLGLWLAIKVFKTTVPVALAMGAALVGGTLLLASQLKQSTMKSYEQGGTIPLTDSGTIFRAGENGKTEAVYTAPNGSTNVTNVQQMKAAFYGALVDYGKAYGGANGETIIYIGEEPVFNAVQKTASKKGLEFAKKG